MAQWAIFREVASLLRDGRREKHVSQQEIARVAGCTPRCVRANVAVLIARGLLVTRMERHADGSTPLFFALGPTTLLELSRFAARWPLDDERPAERRAEARGEHRPLRILHVA